MSLYVGLDVSQKETEICMVDEEGATWRGRCPTRPEASPKSCKGMRPSRLGSAWRRDRWRSGCGTACVLWTSRSTACARHVAAALSLQVNKTDANDAHGIAKWCDPDGIDQSS